MFSAILFPSTISADGPHKSAGIGKTRLLGTVRNRMVKMSSQILSISHDPQKKADIRSTISDINADLTL